MMRGFSPSFHGCLIARAHDDRVAVTNPRTARLSDPSLPAVHDLLGSAVPAPLRIALASSGVRLLSATAKQVTWWPGESITVRYTADVEGALAGRHQVVAVSGAVPPGATVVESGDASVGVWIVPHDPALPGLASALDPGTLRRLLDDLGAVTTDDPVARLRAYRPGRRAVVEVAGRSGSVYIKLVPPDEVARLHRVHTTLASHLPVPRSLGYDAALGMVVLQALTGVTLRAALDSLGQPLPSADALDRLLGSLPANAASRRARSAIDRLDRVHRLLQALLPDEEDRLTQLVTSIGHDDADRGTAVHGDFYEAQVLVDGGGVAGLLDVDTFGWGRVGEDQATMIGHLSLWQQLSKTPDRTRRFGAELLRRWDADLDPVDLRRRAAAVIVSLATGPFRVQRHAWPEETRRRLKLAESWVESARSLDEGHLMSGSSSSHGGRAS